MTLVRHARVALGVKLVVTGLRLSCRGSDSGTAGWSRRAASQRSSARRSSVNSGVALFRSELDPQIPASRPTQRRSSTRPLSQRDDSRTWCADASTQRTRCSIRAGRVPPGVRGSAGGRGPQGVGSTRASHTHGRVVRQGTVSQINKAPCIAPHRSPPDSSRDSPRRRARLDRWATRSPARNRDGRDPRSSGTTMDG
jgi:hypothetical protein